MSILLWKDGDSVNYGFNAANFSRGAVSKPGLTAQFLECNAAKDGVIVKENTIIPFKSGSAWRAQLFESDEEVTTLDTGVLTLGSDYCVYLCDNGTDSGLLLISLNETAPEGYTASNSIKIGGFHYGRVRNSITVGDVTSGAVVPNSVWDLHNRPTCSPRGMAKAGSGFWFDIYLASLDEALVFRNGFNGWSLIAGKAKSEFGATPLVGLYGHNFIELAEMSGKRLLTLAEWYQIAKGSPGGNDGDNVNAWSWTGNTGRAACGTVVNAISLLNAVDCVGNAYEWLGEFLTRGDHNTVPSWAVPQVDYHGRIYGYAANGSCCHTGIVAGFRYNSGVWAGSRALALGVAIDDDSVVSMYSGSRFACGPL